MQTSFEEAAGETMTMKLMWFAAVEYAGLRIATIREPVACKRIALAHRMLVSGVSRGVSRAIRQG